MRTFVSALLFALFCFPTASIAKKKPHPMQALGPWAKIAKRGFTQALLSRVTKQSFAPLPLDLKGSQPKLAHLKREQKRHNFQRISFPLLTLTLHIKAKGDRWLRASMMLLLREEGAYLFRLSTSAIKASKARKLSSLNKSAKPLRIALQGLKDLLMSKRCSTLPRVTMKQVPRGMPASQVTGPIKGSGKALQRLCQWTQGKVNAIAIEPSGRIDAAVHKKSGQVRGFIAVRWHLTPQGSLRLSGLYIDT